MNIFIGTDHRGFELKNRLMEYLQEKNIRIEDMGNYAYDPLDDYTDYATKVAQAVLQNPAEYSGIVICGSGIGASIMVNRYKGIRCALAFDPSQVKHGRENDDINVISIPSNYIDFEKAKLIVDSFLDSQSKKEEKYLRRVRKLDE
jgi:ribose 5-phosphate isomerase B